MQYKLKLTLTLLMKRVIKLAIFLIVIYIEPWVKKIV